MKTKGIGLMADFFDDLFFNAIVFNRQSVRLFKLSDFSAADHTFVDKGKYLVVDIRYSLS